MREGARLPVFTEKPYIAKEPYLSDRQLQALMGICHGLGNKEIAAEMGTTEQCIKSIIREVYRKIRVNNRSSALIHAIRQGWFKP